MKSSAAHTSTDKDETRNESPGFPWKWGIVALIVAGIFAVWFFLPVNQWLNTFTHGIKALGIWGYVVFGLVYIIATVVLAPGALFTLAAGLTFGVWAFPLVIVAATLGAAAAFLIGRYFARERATGMAKNHPKLRAVDRAVHEEGWKIVVLLRLSPLIPFNLQNYFFGVTDIKFWHYSVATFFGIMPGTALYVYLGALGHAAASGGASAGNSVLKWVFFGFGFVATVVVAILVSKKAGAKLDEMGIENQRDQANP